MNSRAVNPVMATVLLIGIATAAGALFYAWYTGVQSGTQEAGGETGARVLQAAGSAMKITDVSNNGNVTITNIGSVTLTHITCVNHTGDNCNNEVTQLEPMKTNKGNITCSITLGQFNHITCTSAEGAVATFKKYYGG